MNKFRAWNKVTKKWYDHEEQKEIVVSGSYPNSFNFDGYISEQCWYVDGVKSTKKVVISGKLLEKLL